MNPTALAEQLGERIGQTGSMPVVVGFDAFLDEVVQVVGTRTSPDSHTPVPTIADFGAWVSASAGRSGLREIVGLERSAGGCSINSADGIASLGFPVDAFSGVGTPRDKVFDSIASKCRSINTLDMDPGRTMVCEFQDGKLMLCSVSHLARFTPEYLTNHLGDGSFLKACDSASGIMLTSWSVYPHMTECWTFLQENVFSKLTHRPHFFLDLADPATRTPSDLQEMLRALSGFQQNGPTTLSLNGNEANRIANALGFEEASKDDLQSIESLALKIREHARISEVGIHTIRSATGVTRDRALTVPSPYCTQPKKSVGAGDRFNAGWLAGALLGLGQEDRLLLGVATSGFFVRNARSGTLPEIIAFLKAWGDGSLTD